jgi:transcriptional regulator with XRE-family HTH domain
MKSLRQLRLSKGLKLTDVEYSLGISQALLSEMERNVRVPNKLTRQRLEVYFGERINWLETPTISIGSIHPTNWYNTEKAFRSLLRKIEGLPDYMKDDFIVTSLKHLRKLRNSTVIRSK